MPRLLVPEHIKVECDKKIVWCESVDVPAMLSTGYVLFPEGTCIVCLGAGRKDGEDCWHCEGTGQADGDDDDI